MRALWILISYAASSMLFSCSPEAENTLESQTESKREALLKVRDSLVSLELEKFNRRANAPDARGIVGVFEVPEMLALVVMDSARQADVAFKRARAFANIEEDVAYTGATTEGSPGSIYYNNDPQNFKFECLMLIRSIPEKSPQHSKVVVLEASPMLVYNHRGPYSRLSASYDEIRQYCDSMNLEQSGPMREFYLVSPVQSPDSSRWLTRIMLPVAKAKSRI